MGDATLSIYSRLYDFMAGAVVRSQEFDDEFNAIAAASRTTIRAVDEVAIDLPNAAARANRLMSFDASGQPQATNSVPDPVADMDVANRRWVQTLALTGVISVGPGDAGKIMSNDGSGIQWTAKDNLFPSMAGKAGYALLTDGSARYWGKVVWMVAYDNRADLRTATGVLLDSLALVDGLGVFQHMAGADEGPDDDETAFQTATGYWMLICPSVDVVEARALQSDDRIATAESFTSKMFRATSTQSSFSLASGASTTFTVTVAGAVVGASVIATPPSNPTHPAVALCALVTAADTVTVYVGNDAATGAAGFGAGDWQITVINK